MKRLALDYNDLHWLEQVAFQHLRDGDLPNGHPTLGRRIDTWKKISKAKTELQRIVVK